MRLLLDTHYVFALACSPFRLTATERSVLASSQDRFVISAVSIWEMRLKRHVLFASVERKGPLAPARAVRSLSGQPIDFLALSGDHATAVPDVPISHGGPFDELPLAQARYEGMKLLTRDAKLMGHALALRAA